MTEMQEGLGSDSAVSSSSGQSSANTLNWLFNFEALGAPGSLRTTGLWENSWLSGGLEVSGEKWSPSGAGCSVGPALQVYATTGNGTAAVTAPVCCQRGSLISTPLNTQGLGFPLVGAAVYLRLLLPELQVKFIRSCSQRWATRRCPGSALSGRRLLPRLDQERSSLLTEEGQPSDGGGLWDLTSGRQGPPSSLRLCRFWALSPAVL